MIDAVRLHEDDDGHLTLLAADSPSAWRGAAAAVVLDEIPAKGVAGLTLLRGGEIAGRVEGIHSGLLKRIGAAEAIDMFILNGTELGVLLPAEIRRSA